MVCSSIPNHVHSDARLARGLGSRGNNDAPRFHRQNFFRRDLVIPFHDGLLPALTNVVNEVVGERVVVVDNEDHRYQARG